ncbi:MAG: CDP-alcohol phosphatidyltransferase family protein [Halobacteriales archaeon]
MTLERLRPLSDAVVDPVVRACLRLGVGPNGVSVFSFAIAAVAAVAFARNDPLAYLVGAALVAASGLLDLVDGSLARELEVASPTGDVLDHTLDRYADIALVGGLALGVDRALIGFLAVTGVLMTSYLGTQAQAVEAGRLYAGVVGRADRIALIVLGAVVMAVAPAAVGGLSPVGWLLVLLAVVGHLTAVQRFVALWRSLE